MSRWISIIGVAGVAVLLWPWVTERVTLERGVSYERFLGWLESPQELPCRTEWEVDARGAHRCEDAPLSGPIFARESTQVVMELDEKTDQVHVVEFRVNSFSPRLQEAYRGHRLVSWGESLREVLSVDDCESVYTPYHDGGLWNCEGASFGHTGVFTDGGGGPYAYLWVGRSVDAIERFHHAQGRREHRFRARRSVEAGLDYMESDHFAAADRMFLSAYLQLSLIPAPLRIPEDDASLNRLAEYRKVLKERADEQREQYQSAHPLPDYRGAVDLVHLRSQNEDALVTLLGEPVECRSLWRGRICVFGTSSWTITVALVGEHAAAVKLERDPRNENELRISPKFRGSSPDREFNQR